MADYRFYSSMNKKINVIFIPEKKLYFISFLQAFLYIVSQYVHIFCDVCALRRCRGICRRENWLSTKWRRETEYARHCLLAFFHFILSRLGALDFSFLARALVSQCVVYSARNCVKFNINGLSCKSCNIGYTFTCLLGVHGMKCRREFYFAYN